MTLKIVKSCAQCGSASIDQDGLCHACGFDARMQCDVCVYKLDARGRCARCARVLPEDLNRLMYTTVYWISCSAHGSHEVGREEQYRAEWKTPDPKDRRKKITHHEWRYRCPRCEFQYSNVNVVESFKDTILLPQQIYETEIEDRMKRWQS